MKTILSLICCGAFLRGYHAWTMLPTKDRRRSNCLTFFSSPSSSSSYSDPKNIDEEQELDPSTHISILNRNLKLFSETCLLKRMGRNEEEEQSDSEGWEDDIHMSLRFALMSHGNVNGMDGPTNNYVNFGACSAFQLPRDALLNMPACRVAAPGVDQEVWSMRIQTLRENPDNFIDEYQGYRSTLVDGRRFFIRDAVVWNCYKDDGEYYGQAILFDRQKVSYAEQRFEE